MSTFRQSDPFDHVRHINPQRFSQLSDRFKFPAPARQNQKTLSGKFKTSLSKLLPHRPASDSEATKGFEMYPLRDRTNRSVTGVSTSSAMLPGINSTPPLPTFQRATPAQLLRRPPQPPQQPLPRLEPAPMNTSRRRVLSEADLLPSPSFSVMPTATALPTTPTPPVLPTRAPARASPRATPTVPATAPTPTVSTARVRPTHRVHQFTAVGSNTGEDKTSHTPSLPRNWSAKHDHLICLYDGKGYSSTCIIRALRKFDPNLKGILYPEQIEKRLRQLDQIPEVDYWRTGFGESQIAGAPTSSSSGTAGPSATDSRRIGHQGRSRSVTGGLRAMLGIARGGSHEGKRSGEGEGEDGVHAMTTDETVENY